MAITAVLRRNLSDTPFPRNGVMYGVPDDLARTETQTVYHYWRWEDEPTMAPIFLNSGPVASVQIVPFANPLSRSVRIFQFPNFISGSLPDFVNAVQYLFTPTGIEDLTDEDDDVLLSDDDTGEILEGYIFIG
jgi:hypothetical protein